MSRFAALLRLALLVAAPAAQAQESPAESATPIETVPVTDAAAEEPPTDAREDTREDATELDVITVTASKRVKAQRDLPGSVGAIRGEDLEKMGAQSMRDYLKLIPGVTLSGPSGSVDTNVPIIRGIATTAGFSNAQLPTGIYVDDMPFTDLTPPLSVPDLNPFDLERVEILKGPQGTLFGAGALAGAVRFVLNKPERGVWQAKFQQSFTDSDFGALSPVSAGAINVPLGDAAALRAVGVYRRDRGIVDDLARPEQDTDRIGQNTWRVLGDWQPLDELRLSAFYFNQETAKADNSFTTFPDHFARQGAEPYASRSLSNLSGANLQASYELDWGDLLYSGNRITKDTLRYAQGLGLGTTLRPPPPVGDPGCRVNCDIGTEDQRASSVFEAFVAGHVEGYFHELRLISPEGADGAFEWLAGAAYLDYHATAHQRQGAKDLDRVPIQELPMALFTPAGPITGTRELQPIDLFLDFFPTEEALFAEGTYRLGKYWEITAGGRAFRTKSRVRFLLHGLLAAAFPPQGETPSTESDVTQFADEQGFNPKISLRYLHSRNVQLYLLAAKGFQFGGPQFAPPSIGQAEIVESRGGFNPAFYRSSKLWNYELGVRTEWLDRRLRLDLAGFYLDWEDLQLQQTVYIQPDETRTNPFIAPTGIGTILAFNIVGNLAKAHSTGVELVFEVKPSDAVAFTSSAAWIVATLDEDYASSNGLAKAGSRLPGTPRFQIANVLNLQRTLPFTDSWLGGISLIHAHTGVAYTNFFQDNPTGGYDTLDAQISLRGKETRWYIPEVSLGLSNLTDVRGATFASTNTRGTATRTPIYNLVRPRTALLSLAFRLH